MTKEKEMQTLIAAAMDCLGVAVTIIDPEGTLLYYNLRAAEILDRKPEYIDKDIFAYHGRATSNEKIISMLQAFKGGRTEPFHYDARPYGKPIRVTVAPIFDGGRFVGCAQSVIPQSAIPRNDE